MPHDEAYKEFFSNPEMLKSLLLDFVPEEFIRDFNFNALELCNSSFISPDFKQRYDDLVWRLQWKDSWCYIYILLEFQSSDDYWMPLRIATYTCLLWQDIEKQGHFKRGDKLPPVFPIVIYNGDKSWKSARNLSDIIESVPASLAKYQVSQEYFLLDEKRLNQLFLENTKGEAGYIFRIERAKSLDEMWNIYQEFKKRISAKKFDSLRRAVKYWLIKRSKVQNLSDEEIQELLLEEDSMLEQKFRQWEKEFFQKGMITGEAKGLHNQKNTLLEMLSLKYGEIPANWKAKINDITDSAAINQLTIAILTVNSFMEYEEVLHKYTA